MAVSEGKTVKIRTEGFDKNSLLGSVQPKKGDSAATQKDVWKIIDTVRTSFQKFTDTQLSYVESTLNSSNTSAADEEISIDDSSPISEQLDRIEDNTNTIISQIDSMGASVAGMAATGAAAGAAISNVASSFTGGKVIGWIFKGLKKFITFLLTNPVFIFALAIVAGLIGKILKPYVTPVIDFVKGSIEFVKGVIDGIKEWWDDTVDGFNITVDAIKGVWESLKEGWAALESGVSSSIDAVVEGWNTTKEALMSAWNSVKSVLDETIATIKSMWNTISEKVGSAVDFFKSISISDTLNSLKNSIQSVAGKLGIDVMKDDRAAAEKRSKELMEERKRLDERLSLQTMSDKERAKLEAERFKNLDESAKLAERIDKLGLANKEWYERKNSTKDSLAEFAKANKEKPSIREYAKTSTVDIKPPPTALPTSVYEPLYEKPQTFGEWMQSNVKTEIAPQSVQRSVPSENAAPTQTAAAQSVLSENTAQGEIVSVDGMNASELVKIDEMNASELVKIDEKSQKPNYVHMTPKDYEGISQYLSTALPDVLEKKISRIKESEGYDEEYMDATKMAMREMVKEYADSAKEMMREYAEKQSKSSDELKRAFEDGKLSKSEIASYMASSNKGGDVSKTVNIVVGNGGKSAKRSM